MNFYLIKKKAEGQQSFVDEMKFLNKILKSKSRLEKEDSESRKSERMITKTDIEQLLRSDLFKSLSSFLNEENLCAKKYINIVGYIVTLLSLTNFQRAGAFANMTVEEYIGRKVNPATG